MGYQNIANQNSKNQMENKETKNIAKSVRLLLTEQEMEQLENLIEKEKRSASNTVSIIVSKHLEELEKEKSTETENQ